MGRMSPGWQYLRSITIHYTRHTSLMFDKYPSLHILAVNITSIGPSSVLSIKEIKYLAETRSQTHFLAYGVFTCPQTRPYVWIHVISNTVVSFILWYIWQLTPSTEMFLHCYLICSTKLFFSNLVIFEPCSYALNNFFMYLFSIFYPQAPIQVDSTRVDLYQGSMQRLKKIYL